MADIISLDGKPVQFTEAVEVKIASLVNEELVESLENLLRRARSAEITGVVYVAIAPDEGFSTGYVAKGPLKFAAMTGMAVLHQRLVDSLMAQHK